MRRLLFAVAVAALTSVSFPAISADNLLPAPQGEPPPSCTGGSRPVCVDETCGGLPVTCVCERWECQMTRTQRVPGTILQSLQPSAPIRFSPRQQ